MNFEKKKSHGVEFSVAQCACCVVLRRVLSPPPKHGPMFFIIMSPGIACYGMKEKLGSYLSFDAGSFRPNISTYAMNISIQLAQDITRERNVPSLVE